MKEFLDKIDKNVEHTADKIKKMIEQQKLKEL